LREREQRPARTVGRPIVRRSREAAHMIGVEPDRVPVGISLNNWLSAPHAHWSFQHVEDMVPTAVISRGTEPVTPLPAASAPVADVHVTITDGSATTVGAVMATTATDGWAVTHRGSMVAEEYVDGLAAQTRHLLFSVSKSLVAAVVGVLHGSGAIDLDAPVTAFVPDLATCGYAGATVRHLLDMRSGIAFSENYGDSAAEIHLLDQAIGWAPTISPDRPSTMCDFLLTLQQKSAHGGPFEYRSCETDVLGWICEAAGGRRMPELMSELLWSRLGAQCDATIGVDTDGTGLFDGGINACLTDMIRFGSLFLHDGVSLTGQQVVPAAWIADTLDGGPGNDQLVVDYPCGAHHYIGGGGNDVYIFNPGDGQVTINNVGGSVAHGSLEFSSAVDDEDLWFTHTSNNLVIQRIGSTDKVTISNWFAWPGICGCWDQCW